MSLEPPPVTEFHRLAYDKLATVLGADKARLIQQQILAELDIELQTAQELYQFSQSLTRMGGFEGAVGAMLGVTAIIRGARASH